MAGAARWWAPGRVTVMGDHTDYNDGWSLPCAIDLGIEVDVRLDRSGVLSVRSTQYGESPLALPLDLVAAGRVEGWAAYVAGSVQLLRDLGVPIDGAAASLDGDLPSGAGLSSSAALVCATLSSFLEAAGRPVRPSQVARWAQQVENDYIGAPVGYLDPAAVMLSESDHLVLIDSRSREVRPVAFDITQAGLVLLVVDSGERHSTSGRIYAARVDQCHAAAAELGVGSLRDVHDPAEVERLADRTLRARARHVVTENARVHAVVDLLRLGRPERIGPHLLASHASLRDDFEVSTPALDLIVDSAMAAGALGARLTGAGMGGCAVVLADRSAAGKVTAGVHDAFVARDLSAPEVIEVRPAAGAKSVGAS